MVEEEEEEVFKAFLWFWQIIYTICQTHGTALGDRLLLQSNSDKK